MIVVLPFLLGAAVLAVLVHLASIFLIPLVSDNDLFARLQQVAPVNESVALALADSRRVDLPFVDPAFQTRVCRYDLSAGVLRLRAPVPETLLLLTAVARGGGVFFTTSDRAAVAGVLEVLIGTDAQIQQIEAADREDEAVTELRVRAPRAEGIAMFRVFAPTPSMLPAAASAVALATCQIETLQ